MRSLKVLMLLVGYTGTLTYIGQYLWRYFYMAEWWRQNIPW